MLRVRVCAAYRVGFLGPEFYTQFFTEFFTFRKIVFGHLHSANVIQLAWKAILPHFSIDFVQISLQGTILSEETIGQGIV